MQVLSIDGYASELCISIGTPCDHISLWPYFWNQFNITVH